MTRIRWRADGDEWCRWQYTSTCLCFYHRMFLYVTAHMMHVAVACCRSSIDADWKICSCMTSVSIDDASTSFLQCSPVFWRVPVLHVPPVDTTVDLGCTILSSTFGVGPHVPTFCSFFLFMFDSCMKSLCNLIDTYCYPCLSIWRISVGWAYILPLFTCVLGNFCTHCELYMLCESSVNTPPFAMVMWRFFASVI